MTKLDKLLQRNCSEVIGEKVNETKKLLGKTNGKIIFFGAGRLGKISLQAARHAGISPQAFVDNNPGLWGKNIQDIPIVSPSEAIKAFGKKATFVITIYTSAPVWGQLRGLGIEPISFASLAWLFPAHFLPHAGLDLPTKIFKHDQAVRQAAGIWADKESSDEFVQQIFWRSTLSPEILRPHQSPANIYFAPDIFTLKKDEVFVDCGAFDGDSIRSFLSFVRGDFKKIFALEPDPSNRARLKTFQASLGTEKSKRIKIFPYAVGVKSEKIFFNASGTAASSACAHGIATECVSLDEVITCAPTLIKMDIEGSEPLALAGASNIIKKHKPILAVCLYHAIEHLWEIPLWIKALVPDYDLFLRRYSDECWEIVCYAVPRTRRNEK